MSRRRRQADNSRALLENLLYLAACINAVLDYIHGVAEEQLCEERDDTEFAEWLSQFDLYEREYRAMAKLRERLIVKSLAVVQSLNEDGYPGGEIRGRIRRMHEESFVMVGATERKLVYADNEGSETGGMTDEELAALDVDLGSSEVREVVENVLALSEELVIPLPAPPDTSLSWLPAKASGGHAGMPLT
ncbi:MAG: hypothetical protein KJ626_05460 [Verrucomicrobia bacterium]|nr:hypothetical protein [Verrucomicrobiota bacterium]